MTLFQSTLPARGATFVAVQYLRAQTFQSTLPARGATLFHRVDCAGETDFNPRSPHGERPNVHSPQRIGNAFQSTLPARGATFLRRIKKSAISYFNPRSPHGERPHDACILPDSCFHFNPRSPHGERRCPHSISLVTAHISIHAPRTGSDNDLLRVRIYTTISIHAPRTGSDCREGVPNKAPRQFQSTLPARGATDGRAAPRRNINISIHAPRTGSDVMLLSVLQAPAISIHAPRTGSDI